MAKEMIISSSAHEKKIAIIEDGVVTEYYVERSDELEGVAGSVYKGRVMKVLPGMQSAFVDIGLDRDAFLYVSDFLEEEGLEEFEPVVDVKEIREVREERRPEPPPKPIEERKPSVFEDRAAAQIKEAVEAKIVETRAVETRAVAETLKEEAAVVAEDEEEFEAVFTQVSSLQADEEQANEGEEVEAEDFDLILAADERNGERYIEQMPEASYQPFTTLSSQFIRIHDDPVSVETVAETPVAEVPLDETTDSAVGEIEVTAAESAEAEPVAVETEPDVVEAESVEDAPKIEEEKTATTKRRSARKEPAKKKAAAAPARKRGGKKAAAAKHEEESEASERFERITDDDIGEAGELLKDAMVQAKIVDRIRRSESDTPTIEHVPEPEVRIGSLQSQLQADANLQRIIDEEGRDAQPNAESQFTRDSQTDGVSTGSLNFVSTPDMPEETGSDESNDSELSDDRANDGGEPEDQSKLPSRASASVHDRTKRPQFSSRRGGRRRGRRGGPGGPGGPPSSQQRSAPGDENQDKLDGRPDRQDSRPDPRQDRPDPRQDRPDPRQDRPDPRQDRPDPRQDRPDPRQDRQAEAPPREPSNSGGRHHQPGISELLHEGQEIVVQIAKEPIAQKGARITSHIALPGRYLVYMPTVNHIGVSRKISSDGERLRLKKIILAIRDRERPAGGFIVRTACEGHTEQELHDDMMYLVRTWQDMKRKGERTKAPAMVYRELDLVQRTLRDQLAEDFTAIRVDNETEYARIVDFVNRFQPKLVKRVKLYTWKKPIFEEHGVQEELDKAIKPRVWLRSGGYIVINQTEALVAIDVNTGKFVGRSNRLEDTITKTNLEAVKEIVRQIRLRDLGGIIVLDFIDMEERKNRQRVMQALETEIKADRSPSKILQFNDFGLVAITRKRVRQSLERTLCSPCSYCQGAGLVKSPQTICYEILAEARRVSAEVEVHQGTEVILRINPEVAEALRGEEKRVFSEIEAYFGCCITIKGDPTVHQERYDFAIM